MRPDSLYSDVTSFAVIGPHLIIAGTDGSGIYLSSNNGISWRNINDPQMEPYVKVLAVMPNGTQNSYLFMATRFGFLYRSADSGNTWTTLQTFEPYEITSVVVHGTDLLAGTFGAGVLLSTDKGITWNEINTGLPDSIVRSLAICGSTLFAATDTSGLWRRPLAEIITSAQNTPAQISSQFILQQNYPNPFNPGTTLSFEIPSKAYVVLKVYDVIGREVATIVSEEMRAGAYSRRWNASGMSSGIYFYRLQAGSVSLTKKLILLR